MKNNCKDFKEMKHILFFLLILFANCIEGKIERISNITETFYQSKEVTIDQVFLATINQLHLTRNLKLKINPPAGISHIILISNATIMMNNVTKSDCYPLRMGIFDLKLPNGDILFQESFEYKFNEERKFNSKVIKITSGDEFFLSYFPNKQCIRSDTTVEITGIVAYSPSGLSSNCPSNTNYEIYQGCTVSKTPICIEDFNYQILELLKVSGVFFLPQKRDSINLTAVVISMGILGFLILVGLGIVIRIMYVKNWATKYQLKLSKGNYSENIISDADYNLFYKDKPEKLFKTDAYQWAYPLHSACLEENTIQVVICIHLYRWDLNENDVFQRSALHYACLKGNTGIVSQLLKHGAHVDQLNSSEQSPLHYVCRQRQQKQENNSNEVTTIFMSSLNNNTRSSESNDENEQTPLHSVCVHDDKTLTENIEMKYQTTTEKQSTEKKESSLLPLSDNRWEKIVKMLLDENDDQLKQSRMLLDEDDDLKRTALHRKPSKNKVTPLHLACEYGYENIVNILLEREEHDTEEYVNEKDSASNSPLHYASNNGHEEIVTNLLSKKADYNSQNWSKQTPLHLACSNGHQQIVNILIGNGADLNIQDIIKATPLYYACLNGHYEIVNLLLGKKADLKLKNWNGQTALHCVCVNNNQTLADIIEKKFKTTTESLSTEKLAQKYDDIVERLLLDSDITLLDMTDKYQKSALHYASENGRAKIVEKLLDKGANMDLVDYQKQTAFHLVCQNGHEEVLMILLKTLKTLKTRAQTDTVDSVAQTDTVDSVAQTDTVDSSGIEKYVNQLDFSKSSSLHYACGRGHQKIVEILLNEGADINLQNTILQTPLHEASKKGHHEIVKLLLKRGAIVNLVDINEQTPLHLACSNGHQDTVNILIQNGANVNIVDNYKKSALHLACENGREEIVKILLKEGANIELVDDSKKSALHLASENGREEIVNILLNQGANIELVDQYQKSALHYASENGRAKIVKKLLDKGANMDLVDYQKQTAFHLVCQNGHEKVLMILLETLKTRAQTDTVHSSGIEKYVNQLDFSKYSSLHYACGRGHQKIVEILLNEGADINLQNTILQTPLHEASKKGHHEIVKLLLKRGAIVNLVDINEQTPLHLACSNGHQDTVNILIQNGANVNIVDNSKKSALHLACENGGKEIVKILLKEGANIELVDDSKKSALHFACENGGKEIVKILLNQGANIELVDQSKKTPLKYAEDNGHIEVCTLLKSFMNSDK